MESNAARADRSTAADESHQIASAETGVPTST
jgi:hypothetical protein